MIKEDVAEEYKLRIWCIDGMWKFEILRESDGAGIRCKDSSFEKAKEMFLSKLRRSIVQDLT